MIKHRLRLCTLIKVPSAHPAGTQGDLWCKDTRDAAFPSYYGRLRKQCTGLFSPWRFVNKISRHGESWNNPSSTAAACTGVYGTAREREVGSRRVIELQRCWAWMLIRWEWERFFLCPPHGSLDTGPDRAPFALGKGTRTNLLHFLPL